MRKIKHKTRTIILLGFFVIYLIALFKITVFKYPNTFSNMLKGELSGVRSLNLIPFVTISEYFRFIISGNKIIGISNILGNLIIFFPLGFISALLFPKMRKLTRILILAFVFSLVIEVCQYIFACGSTDIDDLILNVLGGMAGYLVYILISRSLEPKKYAILISGLMIALTCTGFYASNNYKFLFNRPAPALQGGVKEINDNVIVVSRIYPRNTEDKTTWSATGANEQFKVELLENCKITLVNIQQNGKIIEKKTIEKNDISLKDLMLLKKFLITENGIYMAEEVEIHRVQ
ncbi:VanZ family protein [Lacrimispora brassicae]